MIQRSQDIKLVHVLSFDLKGRDALKRICVLMERVCKQGTNIEKWFNQRSFRIANKTVKCQREQMELLSQKLKIVEKEIGVVLSGNPCSTRFYRCVRDVLKWFSQNLFLSTSKTTVQQCEQIDLLHQELRAIEKENCAIFSGSSLAPPDRARAQSEAQKHKVSSCQRCGSALKLQVHHKDLNWRNNSFLNLETLCLACHSSEHKKYGGFSGRSVVSIPPKTDFELLMAAEWYAKRYVFCLSEDIFFRKLVNRLRTKTHLLESGNLFSQAKRKFTISVWDNVRFKNICNSCVVRMSGKLLSPI